MKEIADILINEGLKNTIYGSYIFYPKKDKRLKVLSDTNFKELLKIICNDKRVMLVDRFYIGTKDEELDILFYILF